MFSDNMLKLANRLINKYGNPVVLIEKAGCVYDPAIGETVCSETPYSMRGTVKSYNDREYSDRIKLGDLNLTITTDLDVGLDWTVEYGGSIWQILAITTTTTQDTVIVKSLQIRRQS
jgi:hypothetical protein